jgi:ATP-binding cassette subfamily A (ABC1) protein 3
VPKFKHLFESLDSSLKKLKINSYGISITTLEEVFLKIAEGDSWGKKNFSKEQTVKDHAKDNIDDFDLNTVRVSSSVEIFFIHFWALCVKKMQYFKRDLKGLACEILMPIIMILIGEV